MHPNLPFDRMQSADLDWLMHSDFVYRKLGFWKEDNMDLGGMSVCPCQKECDDGPRLVGELSALDRSLRLYYIDNRTLIHRTSGESDIVGGHDHQCGCVCTKQSFVPIPRFKGIVYLPNFESPHSDSLSKISLAYVEGEDFPQWQDFPINSLFLLPCSVLLNSLV